MALIQNFDESAQMNHITNRTGLKLHDIVDDYKKQQITAFLEQRKKNPTLKAAEIAKAIGSSKSSVSRILRDFGEKSLYRYTIPKYKKSKHPTTDQNVSKETDKTIEYSSEGPSTTLNPIDTQPSDVHRAIGGLKAARKLRIADSKLKDKIIGMKKLDETTSLKDQRPDHLNKTAKGLRLETNEDPKGVSAPETGPSSFSAIPNFTAADFAHL